MAGVSALFYMLSLGLSCGTTNTTWRWGNSAVFSLSTNATS